MRTLRKRLTCVNRDNCEKNSEAINKVAARYVEKMRAKGWKYSEQAAYICAGNAMFQYELYLTIYKINENNPEDVKFALEYNLS
jgi:hypothetical protein